MPASPVGVLAYPARVRSRRAAPLHSAGNASARPGTPGASADFARSADDWYLLAPIGEFPWGGTPGEPELIQIVDAATVAMLAAAPLPDGGLLLDFDHESHNPDKRSTAAGWIVALRADDAGLWCHIRWSDAGLAAVTGGQYRYLSPTFGFSAPTAEELTAIPRRAAPAALLDAALTNVPNLPLQPLTNRAATQNGAQPTNETKMQLSPETLAALLAMLAIDPATAPEQLDAAVAAAIAAKMSAEEESIMDSKNIPAANRAPWRTLLRANRAAAITAMEAVRGPAATSETATAEMPLSKKLPPQAPNRAPFTTSAPDNGQAQQALVAAIQQQRGCDFPAAWNLARAERPDLFA